MTEAERSARLAALKAARAQVPADCPSPPVTPGPEGATSGPGAGSSGVSAARPDRSSPRASGGRKTHAAAGARWLAAGVSAAATLGMVGAMSAAGAEASSTAPNAVTIVVEPVRGEPTAEPVSPSNPAQAEPAYQVVSAAEPADTTSGGS